MERSEWEVKHGKAKRSFLYVYMYRYISSKITLEGGKTDTELVKQVSPQGTACNNPIVTLKGDA